MTPAKNNISKQLNKGTTSPTRSDPAHVETAPTSQGSAAPLARSMAQFIRLVVCAEEKRIVEQPEAAAAHFLRGKALN